MNEHDLLYEPKNELHVRDWCPRRYSAGVDIFDLTKPFDPTTETMTLRLNQSDCCLGPFARYQQAGGQALADFVHTLVAVELSFEVQNFAFEGGERTCYRWGVAMEYDFSQRGAIVVTVRHRTRLCGKASDVWPWPARARVELVLYGLVFLLAFWAQCLSLRACVVLCRGYMRGHPPSHHRWSANRVPRHQGEGNASGGVDVYLEPKRSISTSSVQSLAIEDVSNVRRGE